MTLFPSSRQFGVAANSPPPTLWFPPREAPPIGSEFVSVQNGQLCLAGQRQTFFGVNCDWWAVGTPLIWNAKTGTMQMDAGLMGNVRQHLDNLVNAGVRAVRIHNLDCGLCDNIFSASNNVQSTTRALDPSALQALAFFWSECRQRNLRIVLSLHWQRQLAAADRPDWPCEAFDECVRANKGLMHPHQWFERDGGLARLQAEYASQILGYVNPYTGIAIGRDATLLAVILQNEHSAVRDGNPFTDTAWPLFNTLSLASLEARCAQIGVPYKGLFSLNKVQIQQWLADVETAYLASQAAAIRKFTGALVIAGTYYGAETYASLIGPATVGDATDFHFYSRYAPSDLNGFLFGRTTADPRTRFGAVAAGCRWGTKPQFCTEWGPVGQFSPLARDSDAERAELLDRVVDAAVAQDLDAAFLYSYGHSALTDGQFSKHTCYDFRDDPILLRGLAAAAARFHDLDLRPSSGSDLAATLPLSDARLYGSGAGTAYTQPGPYTDPDLYAIPAGRFVQMAPA